MAKSMKLGGGGRFAALKSKLAGKVANPAAVAAAIGRKKYGAKKMASMAAKGRKRASKKSSGDCVKMHMMKGMSEATAEKLCGK